MKKILAMMLAVMAIAVTAQGQDRKVGDTFGDGYMNFRVISLNPAEVEVAESPNVEGDVEIPTEIPDYETVYKVTKIGKNAFLTGYENPNITSVVIPEGITEIGSFAFCGCTYVKSWVLPSTLKTIGQSAFYCYDNQNRKLEEVRCYATNPPQCGEMIFGSRFNASEKTDRDRVILYVPKGSVLAYRAEKQWDYFNNIIDMEGEESSTVDEQHYNSDPDADDSGSGSSDSDWDYRALDDVQVNAKAHKYYENGQLVIEKNGVKFNVLGSQVK